MKIYLSASISNLSEKMTKRYEKIVAALESMGHVVIADHVTKRKKDAYKTASEKENVAMQKKLTKWKKQADIVVIEATYPSIGLGQEIAMALRASKPVVVLYHEDAKEPHVLSDEGGDLLLIEPYTMADVGEVLESCIDYASERQDTRFNFFISPKHQNYLDYVAKYRKVPRSVFLRQLIEKHMDRNEEYS